MTGGDDGRVIEAIELTARRRRRRVLDTVSFAVRPGEVTGLLGLPGSGKTAVLRRMLQIDPGGGCTLFGGRTFRSLLYPMRSVGVMLDPFALHPGRTAAGQLRLALSADPAAARDGRRDRIAAVLDVCGLADQARTRIADLTEGMTVRLALAQALLGDPQTLLLDEPDSALEPEGQAWLTALLRAYATQGRCVLVTGSDADSLIDRADRLLVLDDGRLVGERSTRQARRDLSGDCVIVRTPQVLRLAAVLVAAGAEPAQLDGACLEVRGMDRADVGDLAFRNDIPLHELSVRSAAEDPVIAVLQACRRPPAVVPLQAPPTARVPDHAPARVRMPFGTGGPADGTAGGAVDAIDGAAGTPADAASAKKPARGSTTKPAGRKAAAGDRGSAGKPDRGPGGKPDRGSAGKKAAGAPAAASAAVGTLERILGGSRRAPAPAEASGTAGSAATTAGGLGLDLDDGGPNVRLLPSPPPPPAASSPGPSSASSPSASSSPSFPSSSSSAQSASATGGSSPSACALPPETATPPAKGPGPAAAEAAHQERVP